MNAWYVINTKPKKESEVEKQLRDVGYEVFLPRMRGLISPKPLFPSYLFIRANFMDQLSHRLVRYTRGVKRILGDEAGPSPIESGVVDLIQKMTRDGSLVEQELLFRKGDQVTVKRGVLKDLIGIIEKNVSDRGRVKILFKWINVSLRAMLKYTDLEKAA